jgi:hypothetical protein
MALRVSDEAPHKRGFEATSDARRIAELIAAHAEWVYAQPGIETYGLLSSEIDFRAEGGRLIFSCWSERGSDVWRVAAWQWTGEKLRLEATRRIGVERATLELVPRTSMRALTATISAARHARCERLARLVCEVLHGAKLEHATLSAGMGVGHPGRYARIVLRLKRERVAVTGTVAESALHQTDAFLSSALIWFARLKERARTPYVQKLCFIVERDCARATASRIALLREALRRIITLYELDESRQKLTPVRVPSLAELCEQRPIRFRSTLSDVGVSKTASLIVGLAPQAIDVVRARHGETLRYYGLTFARVRRVMARERVWFGLDGARRRPLDENTREDWEKLLRDLIEHRNAAAENYRHALYRAAPEAWLESLLRRDITQLDPGLRLAPLHAQFRTSLATGAGGVGEAARPIDLLAMRRDGRLVVIELKVSADREHVLQGADYWRRIYAQHQAGHIKRARLFDDAEISDEAPLVYLVAPTLRFHRSFQTLAQCITPEIEMYRFDLNEDWRVRVRVARRTRVN